MLSLQPAKSIIPAKAGTPLTEAVKQQVPRSLTKRMTTGSNEPIG
jgi:hypothetical protein